VTRLKTCLWKQRNVFQPHLPHEDIWNATTNRSIQQCPCVPLSFSIWVQYIVFHSFLQPGGASQSPVPFKTQTSPAMCQDKIKQHQQSYLKQRPTTCALCATVWSTQKHSTRSSFTYSSFRDWTKLGFVSTRQEREREKEKNQSDD